MHHSAVRCSGSAVSVEQVAHKQGSYVPLGSYTVNTSTSIWPWAAHRVVAIYTVSALYLHCICTSTAWRALHCTALHCTALLSLHCCHCTVVTALLSLHCTALLSLHCTALHCCHCTALHCCHCTVVTALVTALLSLHCTHDGSSGALAVAAALTQPARLL